MTASYNKFSTHTHNIADKNLTLLNMLSVTCQKHLPVQQQEVPLTRLKKQYQKNVFKMPQVYNMHLL